MERYARNCWYVGCWSHQLEVGKPTAVSMPGSAEEFGADGPPDMSKSLRAWAVSSQAVTPTAPGKARYFFSTGPHRDQGGPAERDGMVATAQMAFAEDKVMIEAQQRNIDRLGEVRMVPSVHDKALTIFNGIERRLAAINA